MPASASAAPASRFSDLGVPEVLSELLRREGITAPFPIQAATLPDALAGRDICGKAPTGSGKTLAFALAVVSRLSLRPAVSRRGRTHPSALVLVPTRELAAQIEEVFRPLASAVGQKVASVYGGVGYSKQLAALRNGAHILVACPGRLEDLVGRKSAVLAHVDITVIDEADRMADMGFLPAVRRLVDATHPERQTLLFSATLDGPVNALVRDYQCDPEFHEVAPARDENGTVHHHFWKIEDSDRVAVAADVIAQRGPAVVFCRTKRGADRLAFRLARSGLLAAAIHGDRSQSQRERALAQFRAGRLDVLVATDIAARGIHVDEVPLVVHFDPPADETDYVHRSGRTGRAGADGNVVTLVPERHRTNVRLMQKKLGYERALSAPDVESVASVGAGVRSRQGHPTHVRTAPRPAEGNGKDRTRKPRPGRANRGRT